MLLSVYSRIGKKNPGFVKKPHPIEFFRVELFNELFKILSGFNPEKQPRYFWAGLFLAYHGIQTVISRDSRAVSLFDFIYNKCVPVR